MLAACAGVFCSLPNNALLAAVASAIGNDAKKTIAISDALIRFAWAR